MASVNLTIAYTAAPGNITMGLTTTGNTVDNANGGTVTAQVATLSVGAMLQTFSFFVVQPAGGLTLGLYSNNGGYPGTLLAQSPLFVPIAGWNVVAPQDVPQGMLLLAPGTYWLAHLPSSDALVYGKQANSGVTPLSRWLTTTMSSLPAVFPSGASTSTSLWSEYATLRPSAPVNYTTASGAIYTTEDVTTPYTTEF